MTTYGYVKEQQRQEALRQGVTFRVTNMQGQTKEQVRVYTERDNVIIQPQYTPNYNEPVRRDYERTLDVVDEYMRNSKYSRYYPVGWDK